MKKFLEFLDKKGLSQDQKERVVFLVKGGQPGRSFGRKMAFDLYQEFLEV